MEITLDTFIALAGLFIGGGGGAFFTWRWQRAKAKAEAEQAEMSATKEMQDMYQQLIEDVKHDRQDQRQYIDELKADRNHLREDRDLLCDRIDRQDDEIRNLKRDVARNGRQLEALRPFICARLNCQDRVRVTISEIEKNSPQP